MWIWCGVMKWCLSFVNWVEWSNDRPSECHLKACEWDDELCHFNHLFFFSLHLPFGNCIVWPWSVWNRKKSTTWWLRNLFGLQKFNDQGYFFLCDMWPWIVLLNWKDWFWTVCCVHTWNLMKALFEKKNRFCNNFKEIRQQNNETLNNVAMERALY